MKIDLLKIITGLLVKAYKLTDGEVTELLNSEEATEDSVIGAILEKDQTRVATLLKDKAGKFQEGYKKAKGEVLSEFEKELREKYGIDDEALTGNELVEAIVKATAPEGGKKPKELTDDDVRKHRVYLDLETASKKLLKAKETEWQQKWDNREVEIQEGNSFNTASSKILNTLSGLNPVLPKNAKAAENQKQTFLESFREFKFKQEGDKILVLDKDGKPVTDGHGYSVELDDLVKNRASEYFDFAAQNGGSNGGNGKEGENQGGGAAGPKQYPQGIERPKDQDKYLEILNDSSIPYKDRVAVKEAWEAENTDK